MKDLNGLRDRAYKTACEHGFHDEEYSDEHLLCLVISELIEAVQADKKGIRADMDAIEKYEDYLSFKELFERFIKDTVEDELADTVIRILDFAGMIKCDIRLEEYPDIVYGKNTFTENVYYITRILTNDDYNIGVKLSFALAQIFALADILKTDLMWHIETKMRYNELREYKHGCKY